MRVRFPDGGETILGYCTNVHPIEALDEVEGALSRWCRPVRERLGASRLAPGLWLSRRASRELAGSADARRRLRDGLESAGLEVGTLNGFPYGDFHADRVKEEVYRPDWTDARRYEYTLDLARILAELQPADLDEGTISTLPVGYAAAAEGAGRREEILAEGATRLAHLAIDLDRLAQRSGRAIRVCIEPEPGCVVETSTEAIAFFDERLRSAAKRRGVGSALVDRHLGLCFDCCHQAVQFEDGRRAWDAIADAGIRIGKVQLSCGLAVGAGGEGMRALAEFDEPRFLHQARRRRQGGPGGLESWMDLPAALESRAAAGETRVHFHVPLHWSPGGGPLGTTQAQLLDLLPGIAATRPLPHLEVETYTWSVLPESLRPGDDDGLVAGIAREIEFVEQALAGAGMERVEKR